MVKFHTAVLAATSVMALSFAVHANEPVKATDAAAKDAKARTEMKSQDTTSAAYEADVEVDAEVRETTPPTPNKRTDSVANETADTKSEMLNQSTGKAAYDVDVDAKADAYRVPEQTENPHPVPETAKATISELPKEGTVTLTGTIKEVEDDEFELQDETGTIDVMANATQVKTFSKGDKVQVTGTVNTGMFNKDFVAENVVKVD